MDRFQTDKEVVLESQRPRTSDNPDELIVPDGGFEAWRTIVGAWLVFLGTFGSVYTFGVYEDFYSREYLANHSPSSISWIGSFQLTMPFVFGPIAGKIFDDGGFHALEIGGCLVFTLSLFMLSLAEPGQYYQVFLSQAVGMGLGLGLTFVPTLGIVVHHFKRRRGLASGIALSGSSVGATIFPIMFNHLIYKLGFGGTVRATGAIIAPCLFLGNSLMRTRLPTRNKGPNSPKPDIKLFFVDAPYMWAVLGMFLCLLGLYFPLIYIQLFSVQHRVNDTLAFYSVAIMNIAGGLVRILANHLGDVFGPFNVQLACSICCGAVIWAMLSIHDGASLVIVSLLYGALSSSWLALAVACLASLSRKPEEVGARTGVALALMSMGVLVAPPIQGALLKSTFIWINAVGFSASMMFAGACCFTVTRTLQSRKTANWRA